MQNQSLEPEVVRKPTVIPTPPAKSRKKEDEEEPRHPMCVYEDEDRLLQPLADAFAPFPELLDSLNQVVADYLKKLETMSQPNQTSLPKHYLHKLNVPAFARDVLNFHPDPVQHKLLATTASRCILNCSRQWGKSTVTAIKALHHAIFRNDSFTIVVSPSDRQSAEFIRKISGLASKAGFKLRGDGKNPLSLVFPNKSRIVGLPCNEDTIRGFSGVTLLLIDEASRVPDSLYRTVRPMLASSGGALWLLSTPAGRSGFFYNTWKASNSLENWVRISVPATECSRITKSFLEAERIEHGELNFRQEYLCEFHDSDDQLLSHQHLEAALCKDIEPLHQIIPKKPIKDFQHVVVYSSVGEEPVPPEFTKQHKLYVGIDFGQVQDHTAIVILEKSWVLVGPVSHWNLGRAREERFAVRHLERLPLGTPYIHVVARIGNIVRSLAPEEMWIAADANGVGAPVIEMVRDLHLDPRLFPVKVVPGDGEQRPVGSAYPVPRGRLITQLLLQFENPQFKIASNLELAPVLLDELASLRLKVTAAGNEIYVTSRDRQHDDLLFALALANWAAEFDKWRDPHGRLCW